MNQNLENNILDILKGFPKPVDVNFNGPVDDLTNPLIYGSKPTLPGAD